MPSSRGYIEIYLVKSAIRLDEYSELWSRMAVQDVHRMRDTPITKRWVASNLGRIVWSLTAGWSAWRGGKCVRFDAPGFQTVRQHALVYGRCREPCGTTTRGDWRERDVCVFWCCCVGRSGGKKDWMRKVGSIVCLAEDDIIGRGHLMLWSL